MRIIGAIVIIQMLLWVVVTAAVARPLAWKVVDYTPIDPSYYPIYSANGRYAVSHTAPYDICITDTTTDQTTCDTLKVPDGYYVQSVQGVSNSGQFVMLYLGPDYTAWAYHFADHHLRPIKPNELNFVMGHVWADHQAEAIYGIAQDNWTGVEVAGASSKMVLYEIGPTADTPIVTFRRRWPTEHLIATVRVSPDRRWMAIALEPLPDYVSVITDRVWLVDLQTSKTWALPLDAPNLDPHNAYLRDIAWADDNATLSIHVIQRNVNSSVQERGILSVNVLSEARVYRTVVQPTGRYATMSGQFTDDGRYFVVFQTSAIAPNGVQYLDVQMRMLRAPVDLADPIVEVALEASIDCDADARRLRVADERGLTDYDISMGLLCLIFN